MNCFVTFRMKVFKPASPPYHLVISGFQIYCTTGSVCPFPHTPSPSAAASWSCGGTLLVSLPCFSEMFRLWVIAVVSGFSQWHTAEQCSPCCVGLCFFSFSQSPLTTIDPSCAQAACFWYFNTYLWQCSLSQWFPPCDDPTLCLLTFFSVF